MFHIAVALVALTAGVWTQTQRPGEQPTRDTSAPRRDDQTPTGRIAGRVIAADTGRPVKRARVFISAPDLPEGRGALTDDNGRFDLTGLPASRYTLTASKSGFITLSYGQRRPLQLGTPIQLLDGQQLTTIEFSLPRSGVVAGQVFDEDGEPLAGIVVRVMRYQYLQGQRRLVPAGTAQTDDAGQYRVWGLTPGTYYVNAVARLSLGYIGGGGGRGGGRGGEDVMGTIAGAIAAFGGGNLASLFGQDDGTRKEYAPTYFPGVSSVAEAEPVTVGLGDQVLRINFNLQLVHTVRVSGHVTTADNTPSTTGNINLVPDSPLSGAAQIGINYGGPIRADNSFSIGDVPPGKYTLRARSGSTDLAQYASLPITIAGSDVADVVVVLVPGATISGTVTFEGTTPDLQRFRIAAPSIEEGWSGPNPTSTIDENGHFTLEAVPIGFHLIRPTGNGLYGWMLKSVTVDGSDVTDTPFEVKSNQKVASVAVVFTNKLTEINGTVADDHGTPIPDFTVLAFSSNPSVWYPQSRHIATARPDQTGKYTLRGLPAGEYYLTTVDPAEQGEWYDRGYLERHRSGAARLAIPDGGVKTQDFKVRPQL